MSGRDDKTEKRLLLIAILATEPAKLNWSVLATIMGEEATTNTVRFKYSRLKDSARRQHNQITTLPTDKDKKFLLNVLLAADFQQIDWSAIAIATGGQDTINRQRFARHRCYQLKRRALDQLGNLPSPVI